MTPEQFINKWFKGNHAQRKKMEKDLKTLILGDLQVGKWYWIPYAEGVVRVKLLDKTDKGLLVEAWGSVQLIPEDRVISEYKPPHNPMPSIIVIILGIAILFTLFTDKPVIAGTLVVIQGFFFFKYRTYANP